MIQRGAFAASVTRASNSASSDGTHPGFDAEYYLLSNPDVAQAASASGRDPFAFAYEHWSQFGWKEWRNPNAVFDTKGYLNAYADVKAAGVDPLMHYDQSGWKEGRDPSKGFDTTAYLAAYGDVAKAKIDPMLQYLQQGAIEGRNTFGDTSFGWRFASAVFGCLTVLVVTRTARRMFRSNLFGAIAGLLIALDGLSLVLARTALLDVFLQFFVVAAFGAREMTTAKWMSERAGERTEIVASYNTGQSSADDGRDSTNSGTSYQQVKLPFIAPQEFLATPNGFLNIWLAGSSATVPAFAPDYEKRLKQFARTRRNPYRLTRR